MPNRTWPVLYRKITVGDKDYNGDPLIVGNRYLTEGLVPSLGGSVLTVGSLESITLNYAKQPISMRGGSEGGFNRMEMDDGSTLDILKRSSSNMVTEAWTFNSENMPTDDWYALKRFMKKVGNHYLVQAVDPDGDVIYGKISGQYESTWFIRGGNLTFTIQQEPGVLSL